MLDKTLQKQLLDLARESIRVYLEENKRLSINPEDWPEEVFEPGATFVTLNLHGHLRGCIGTLEAQEALINNISDNAINAAFRDPRFPPLSQHEFEQIEIEISILGKPEVIDFNSCKELETLLRPEEDGLIIEAYGSRAVFLPQVWESLTNPHDFITQLKLKAGIPLNTEPPALKGWRFKVEHFE